MNETELTCFLCRDDANMFYKICDCNDSIICKDCYYIGETQYMNTCGICRTPYVFNYKRDYIEHIRLLVVYGLKYGLILGAELLPPCYLYFKEDNDLFLGFSFFCIFLVNVLNYYLIINLNRNDNVADNFVSLFNPIKCVYLIVLFIILETSNKDYINKMYTYSLCAFGLLYITPLILFGMIIFINQMIKFNDFINERIFTRTIKIKQIIHNNLEADNLNCAINNV
jgi:hypothetical protein